MHFFDLTRYTYNWPGMFHRDAAHDHFVSTRGMEPGTVNIGWLGGDFDFPVGEQPSWFLEVLAALCDAPIHLTRGAHVCELCGCGPSDTETGFGPILGDGEIRLKGDDGTIYAAPTMILHYVRDHHYAPPAAFQQAVMRYCRRCRGLLEPRDEDRCRGAYCRACGEWAWVTTFAPPIVEDRTIFTVTVEPGESRDLAHVKAVATVVGEGYVRARDRLRSHMPLRFRAEALDLLPRLAYLDGAAMRYTIEPDLPYTQADMTSCGVSGSDRSFHLIDGIEVAAPVATRISYRDLLAAPEIYPGLKSKARSDRALLLVRRPALARASAYALFHEAQIWTLRRIEWDHDPRALSGEASFGADALVEGSVARQLLAQVRARPWAGADAFPQVIDGPDRFEIDLDGSVSAFADYPEFASDTATINGLMAAMDRMLPKSTLRQRAIDRRGRWRDDQG